jgi:hypothetical protein
MYTGGHVTDEFVTEFSAGLVTTTEKCELDAHLQRCPNCRWKIDNWKKYLALDPDARKEHWINDQYIRQL